jgi:hypothetical protein
MCESVQRFLSQSYQSISLKMSKTAQGKVVFEPSCHSFEGGGVIGI